MRVKAPTNDKLTQLTQNIAKRIARYLERQGSLARNAESSYLTSAAVDADNEVPMKHLLGSSITYRIAMAPQHGRRVFTLQTLHDCRPDNTFTETGNVAGFSLHAGPK